MEMSVILEGVRNRTLVSILPQYTSLSKQEYNSRSSIGDALYVALSNYIVYMGSYCIDM